MYADREVVAVALCTLVVVLGVGLDVGLGLANTSVGTASGFSRLYTVAWFPGHTRQPTVVLVQSSQLQSAQLEESCLVTEYYSQY